MSGCFATIYMSFVLHSLEKAGCEVECLQQVQKWPPRSPSLAAPRGTTAHSRWLCFASPGPEHLKGRRFPCSTESCALHYAVAEEIVPNAQGNKSLHLRQE